MLPGWGPEVVELVQNRYFVVGDGAGGTWCLAIYPEGTWCLAIYPEADGSRLVSRWRQEWKREGLASWFFITFADPGAFIMEQKMLRGIKKRAESHHPSLHHRTNASGGGAREEAA